MDEFNLEQLDKKLPYTVADDFFETVTQSTLQRIQQQNRRHRLHRILYSCSSIAACGILCVGVFSFIHRSNSEDSLINQYLNSNVIHLDRFIDGLSQEEASELLSNLRLEDEFYYQY